MLGTISTFTTFMTSDNWTANAKKKKKSYVHMSNMKYVGRAVINLETSPRMYIQ
jgi:hypothetical protein